VEPVAVPVFDRAADLARAGARIITPAMRIVLVEGNYLLLDRPPWTELAELFDLTIFVAVDEEELERRHLQRWRDHGWEAERARRHVDTNDLPNGRLVMAHSREADITIGTIDLGR
jgi:pantothenate kinase